MSNKKKIKKLVDKYRLKFKKSEKAVEINRENWNSLDGLIRGVFDDLKPEHEKDPFYSNLFIQDENYFHFSAREIKNRRHTAMRFGHKPLNISEVEFDPATQKPKRFKQELETGGALFFSQGINGDVAVYLFSSKNDLVKIKDNLLLLKIYGKPTDIKERHILKHLSQFFWFSLVTSYLSGFSLVDRVKLIYYKFRSGTLKINWVLTISLLILTVSIINFIYNLLT